MINGKNGAFRTNSLKIFRLSAKKPSSQRGRPPFNAVFDVVYAIFVPAAFFPFLSEFLKFLSEFLKFLTEK